MTQARIVERLNELRRGEPSVQYKLRDWLISRQRYWGPPIPIIHCPRTDRSRCRRRISGAAARRRGLRPRGTGLSPLATVEEWVTSRAEVWRAGASRDRRERHIPRFRWYHLRYPSTDFDDVPFDKERTDQWLPVDMYIGGNEHAVRHLSMRAL